MCILNTNLPIAYNAFVLYTTTHKYKLSKYKLMNDYIIVLVVY